MTPRAQRALRLRRGESAIFGYGSLLSIKSMQGTLGREYDGPFLPCAIRGWRRTWDAAMPNRRFFARTSAGRMTPKRMLYLNITPEPETDVNGIIFTVNSDELDGFDRRESIYDRICINDDFTDLSIDGGDAYVYVCRPEFRFSGDGRPEHGAVRRTYIEIIEGALSELGAEFREQYERSTDPVPQELIIHDEHE